MPPTPTIGMRPRRWRNSDAAHVVRARAQRRAAHSAGFLDTPPDDAAARNETVVVLVATSRWRHRQRPRRRMPGAGHRLISGDTFTRTGIGRSVDCRTAIDHLLDQRRSDLSLLQRPETSGVWRTDVDDEVIGDRMQEIDGLQIVVDRPFIRRVLVLPDIDADAGSGPDLDGPAVDEDRFRATASAPSLLNPNRLMMAWS